MGALVPDDDLPAPSRLVPADDMPNEAKPPPTEREERNAAGGRFLKKAGEAVLNMVRPGQYPLPPAGSPRNSGESDQQYALRGAHEAFKEMASPEGIGRSAAMAGLTLPGGASGPTPVGGSTGPAFTGLLRKTPNPTLAGAAESAAVRSLNADRTATRKAFKNSDAARHESGRFLLDEDVPLRSPQAAREGLQEIKAQEGPVIGALAQKADASGATFDLGKAAQEALASPDVANLAKNTEHRAIFDRVKAFLDDQVAQHGAQVKPTAAHDLRQQLDALANWDQTKTKEAVDAWRAVRGAVTDELGQTMDRAALGDEWAASNARFKNAARAEPLAKIGAERREGNRFLSPSEKAGALAGGAAALLHNPVAGVALPAATVLLNRYSMPVAARSLDFAAKHFPVGPTAPSAAAAASPLSAALLRAKLVPELRLRPVAADEDGGPSGP